MLSSAETCQLAEEEICTCLERQRARLEREAGLRPPPSQHFYRPVERAFTAEERGRVTILLGGLTWKHEQLIRAVMEGCGYRCQTLPQPSHAACELGREYGNVGQCNPSYYTVGSLLQFLRQLEAQGLSRKEILDRYVLFTVGSCGPCRFGMYESEYRLALCNAGFKGFRVLLFQQTDGIKASSGEPGLKFSMDFGLGIANAFQVADVLNDVLYRVRPYEVNEGETNRVFEQVLDSLGYFLRDRERFEILERTPPWFSRRLAAYPFCKGVLNGLGKMREHFRGRAYLVALEAAREQINAIEVDRTRVKPLVKIVGEFWAQTTEGEGNFNMFAFLEREGAQVLPEPISTWVMYLIYEAKARALERKGLRAPAGWGLCERLREELKFRKRWNLLSLGEHIWSRQYSYVAKALGELTHGLIPQDELARLARPYYHPLVRGGEGHLEVGKNIYYTTHHLCHMTLSLKPFGCLPSSQSDGVQAVVAARFPEMIFLPIETSPDGEIHAHSRVQMALSEARKKAQVEFEQALSETGRRLEEIQDFAASQPELRRALYRYRQQPGVAGVAANFILHVHRRMKRRMVWPAFTPLSRPEPMAGAQTVEPSAAAQQRTVASAGQSAHRYVVGVDIGSITVKAVVLEEASARIVWRAYHRHEGRQPERVLELLLRLADELGIERERTRIFITGSGGSALADLLGAKFIHEVHAVLLAVERLHPEARSVIELGGQDAKILLLDEVPGSGRKKKTGTMNDKCAGGTGAVIDKVGAKLGIAPDALPSVGYRDIRLHAVAGKCGVFAETDINSLQKQGVHAEELMASLFDALVLQNLSVLTRGRTLRPPVLLLGGPNTFFHGLREAWQAHLQRMWRERQVTPPAGAPLEELVAAPPDAQFFGAIGAALAGQGEEEQVGRYRGPEPLERYISVGRHVEKTRCGIRALSASPEELQEFRLQYTPKPFAGPTFAPGQRVRAILGIDGGSTSTKGVLLSEQGDVLLQAYQLSQGNPIRDTIQIIESLRQQVESQGAQLEVLGAGTTGYAKDILRDVLCADVALVETVAHAESALRFYDDPQVIVDVGGQDIKILVLRNGRVKDFKLNTQCSAGNGFFLQKAAEGFGIRIEDFAEVAFTAQAMPAFSFGCAVFLQADIVNFQRQGWRPEEILAGLAAVLPKNVFLYVAGMPNLARLGRRFVLQGGTQKNLAAVKAQVDFIRSRFGVPGQEPEIFVHPHCAECGAIGTAIEALRLVRQGHRTRFIGLDAVRHLTIHTARDERTRCRFCTNACLRTFIDIRANASESRRRTALSSAVPLEEGERRLIIASCEQGAVEDVQAMREIKARVEAVKAANPNLVEWVAREVWKPRHPEPVADPVGFAGRAILGRQHAELRRARDRLRVGLPRALYLYVYAPLFSAYLESLGVPAKNLVYSDFTSTELYRGGASRGAIDPCFPSKVALAHLHNLVGEKHRREPLHCIFFPMFDGLHSPLVRTVGHNACPTVTATPQTLRAAFTKDRDLFAECGLHFLHPLLDLSEPRLFARQMFRAWEPVLGLSEAENERAVEAGFRAQREFEAVVRKKAREVINLLEREGRVGIVMLGRPYHHDPGIHHGIPEQFQKLGYPVLSQSTLPLDADLLERLFGEEVRAGRISDPLDISDVWKNSFSASSNHKLWAAKFVARHPNLVAVEVSSFKCGHDAPIYSAIEEIIERSGKCYFGFKDLDENKAAGSIKLRVETIDYVLRRYRDDLIARRPLTQQIQARLQEYERYLRSKQPRAAAARPAGPASTAVGA